MKDGPTMTSRVIEKLTLHADAGRALRTALAFGIPLTACHLLHRPQEAVFVALTAQIIALQDLRGAYGVRLTILAAMACITAGAGVLGVMTGGNPIATTLGMGLIAILSGVWRHLSSDYGPPMGIASALLFLLGTLQPGGWGVGIHLAELALLGGLVAAAMQIAFWLFRPQHALRTAVAETWVAGSELLAKMRTENSGETTSAEPVATAERELRVALERTFAILGTHKGPLVTHLEEMRREVVHFSMRAITLNSVLESIRARPDFARHLPVVDSVLKSLGDAARSVAVTLITHRPENFAFCNVRLRRSGHLIQVLEKQLSEAAGDNEMLQLHGALAQMGQVLPKIAQKLGETIDHSAARTTFPEMLPDLSTRSMRSLTAWIDFPVKPDPVLVRHSARMAAATMLAVAFYKGFHIPRGYWMPLTIVIVLQPDYGATRERAVQRTAGTLAGVILGGALMGIKLPLAWIDGLAIGTSFCFAWIVKRLYWAGIFFVTLQVVLITETTTTVKGDFTIDRLICTMLGGAIALVAALVFWPMWEGNKFPALLAVAVRANSTFLDAISAWLGIMPATPLPNLLMTRRAAENANRYAAESLKRMTAEPYGRNENATRAASLATYNQRITRALTAAAVHTEGGVTLPATSAIPGLISDIREALGHLSKAIDGNDKEGETAALAERLEAIEGHIRNSGPGGPLTEASIHTRINLIWSQLVKCAAEIRAMTLVMAPANSAETNNGNV